MWLWVLLVGCADCDPENTWVTGGSIEGRALVEDALDWWRREVVAEVCLAEVRLEGPDAPDGEGGSYNNPSKIIRVSEEGTPFRRLDAITIHEACHGFEHQHPNVLEPIDVRSDLEGVPGPLQDDEHFALLCELGPDVLWALTRSGCANGADLGLEIESLYASRAMSEMSLEPAGLWEGTFSRGERDFPLLASVAGGVLVATDETSGTVVDPRTGETRGTAEWRRVSGELPYQSGLLSGVHEVPTAAGAWTTARVWLPWFEGTVLRYRRDGRELVLGDGCTRSDGAFVQAGDGSVWWAEVVDGGLQFHSTD